MKQTVFGLYCRSVVMGAAVFMVGSALPAMAETQLSMRPLVLAEAFPQVSGYDPVAHALALGLTPEAVDARFDRGLFLAEQCSPDSLPNTIGCDLRTAALKAFPTS